MYEKDLLHKAVKSLGIKFPIATISKDLGYSQGVISRYYNGKVAMSESFVKHFENHYNVSLKDFYGDNKTVKISKADIRNEDKLTTLVKFILDNYHVLKDSRVFSMLIKKVENDYEIKRIIDDTKGDLLK